MKRNNEIFTDFNAFTLAVTCAYVFDLGKKAYARHQVEHIA